MKTIIFDFDGTLADSFNLILEIAHDLTRHPKLVDQKEIAKLRELQLSKIAKELNIPKLKWPYLLFKGRKLMLERLSEVKPFGGIANLFSSLKDQNLTIYIMSSNSQKNIELFLKKYNLYSSVDKIYGGVGLSKKARTLKKILKSNDLDNKDVCYVGDEPRDIEASKKVMVKIIAVSWGFNSRNVLSSFKPDYLVDRPSDILKLI